MSKILGLDVSTKTIGVALFDENARLTILKNITPKPKPIPNDSYIGILRDFYIISNIYHIIEF